MKLLLIDSSALFHRSRSALFRAMGEMTTSYGIPVTGTYGFCNALFSVMSQHGYDCVVPCVDKGGNFRKKESSTYKANREKGSIAHYADMGLLLEDVLPALGFTPVGKDGYEADDIIAHISREAPSSYSEIHILTCDRDLLQLINPRVKVLLFNSAKKINLVGEDEVGEYYGVPANEIKFYKALCGDASDNIAGLKGVGPKKALSIIDSSRPDTEDWLSFADRILLNLALNPKLKDQGTTFIANLRLVNLDENVPDLTWYSSSSPKEEEVRAIFSSLEFKSFLKESRMSKILKALGVSSIENSLGSNP